ncbi:MAG: sulfatase [Armatimonadota bacterium]
MNVLVIAIDTLRADRMSCYGYPRATTPQIDTIARDGVVFEEFIAPYIPTHPGFTTMFCGKDVFSHEIVTQGGKHEPPDDIVFLPEILREHGYFTAAADNLGRWFSRGYDMYETFHWERDTSKPWRKAEAVNETAMEVLGACESQDRPWFVFLHYWDPHTPYLPPPPFDRMFYSDDETDPQKTSAAPMMEGYPAFQHYFADWMPGLTDIEFPRAQYDAEIAYCDAALSHIFTRLAEMDGAEDTLILITSDHGEELDEHEMYFDHHGLYETNMHVPLIAYHPELFSGGRRVEGMTVHQDFAPTVLDALGLDAAADEQGMQGKSLLQYTNTGSTEGTREFVYICECAWMKKRGIRTQRHKFFESLYDELHHRPQYELYDLREDPFEQNNLADREPQRVEQFLRQMQEFADMRLQETGRADPIMSQDITLTRVGNVDVAVPDDQVLEE